MALAGEGAICIWNDITDEARDEFYAWHQTEHMPERVGIPGFVRGRRYLRVDAETKPDFFTLYEVVTPEVLVGQDYANRLNAPTPWTKATTSCFLNTARALTRVRASYGPGSGGMLLTLRFAVPDGEEETVAAGLADDSLRKVAALPQITGAHLCLTNETASKVETAETRGRSDIEAAPAWVILIEGCNLAPLETALATLLATPAGQRLVEPRAGWYRLEYTRLKTAWTAG